MRKNVTSVIIPGFNRFVISPIEIAAERLEIELGVLITEGLGMARATWKKENNNPKTA